MSNYISNIKKRLTEQTRFILSNYVFECFPQTILYIMTHPDIKVKKRAQLCKLIIEDDIIQLNTLLKKENISLFYPKCLCEYTVLFELDAVIQAHLKQSVHDFRYTTYSIFHRCFSISDKYQTSNKFITDNLKYFQSILNIYTILKKSNSIGCVKEFVSKYVEKT